MSNDRSNSNNNASKKALVIAVSDYDNSSGLKPIEFCKNDGQEMYNVFKKNGYDIPDSRKLIGYVDSERLKKTIYDFFTGEDNKPDDTLVFYYSGHGIPDKWGKTFFAPSDMDSDHPRMTGFSFEDLTDTMLECNSLRVVTILDSCYSGSLKISKGLGLDSKSGGEAAARIANSSIEEKSNKLKQGVGRCLLAASQGFEEAYDRIEKDHSIFTYYLLEGLKGHKNAVDEEGNVTYDSLGKFITREIGNLPPEKRPKQTPIRKGEVSGGEIVLANYPELRKTKEFDYYALYGKGDFFFNKGLYKEALKCYEELLKTFPNEEYALLRKVKILYKLNFDTNALEIVEKLLDRNKKNATAWYLKSFYFIRTKDYPNALKCLNESLSSNPNDEKIWEAFRKIKLAEASEQSGNPINNMAFESLLEIDSDKKEWKITSQYVEPKPIKDSESDLEDKDLYIINKEVAYWLDKALREDIYYKGQFFKGFSFEETDELYEEIPLVNKLPCSIKKVASISTSKISLKLYTKEINEEIKEDPTDVDALTRKCLVLFIQGKGQEAIEWLDKAIGIDPADVTTLSIKGIILFIQGKGQEAIEWLDKALRIDPADVTTLYIKGFVLYAQGNYREALKLFDKASKINTNFALIVKAFILLIQGNYKEAIESLDNLDQNKTGTEIAISWKAFILLIQGNYKEAIELLDHIFRKSIEEPELIISADIIITICIKKLAFERISKEKTPTKKKFLIWQR